MTASLYVEDFRGMEISRTINGWRTGGLEGRSLLKPNLAAHYPTAIRGEGPNLFDSEGRRYFDGSLGAMTNSRTSPPGCDLNKST